MKDYLHLIKHLYTIIEWFKYSSLRWGGKIASFDAIDSSIVDIIERDAVSLNEEENSHISKRKEKDVEMLKVL